MAWLTLRAYGTFVVNRDLDVTVEGHHHVPRHGPVILAAHHEHHLYDGCAILAAVDRPLHVMVALDWARSPFQRRLLETTCRMAHWPGVIRPESYTLNQQHQYKPGDRRARLRDAAHLALELLQRGEALLMFPEGYPRIDPWPTPGGPMADPLPLRRGFADLAWRAQHLDGVTVPIVPVSIAYAADQPRSHLTLHFHEPITLTHRGDIPRIVRQVQTQIASPTT